MATSVLADADRPSAESGGPEAVLDLLREQRQLFARLATFAERQKRLVREADTRPLLRLLADRQRLSAELTTIAQRLEPARKDWSSFRGRLTEGERNEADELVEDARRMLRKLIEGDEQDARVLSVRKRLVHDQIRAGHATGMAVSAYHCGGGNSGGRRLDEAT